MGFMRGSTSAEKALQLPHQGKKGSHIIVIDRSENQYRAAFVTSPQNLAQNVFATLAFDQIFKLREVDAEMTRITCEHKRVYGTTICLAARDVAGNTVGLHDTGYRAGKHNDSFIT